MRVSLRRRLLNSLALQRYKLRKRSKRKWWCMMKWCPRYFPSSETLGERTLFGEKIWDGWTQLLAKFNYRKLKYPSFQKIVILEKWKVSERFAKLAVVSLRWNNEPQRPHIYGNIVFLKRMRLRNELELFVLFITKFQVECRFWLVNKLSSWPHTG